MGTKTLVAGMLTLLLLGGSAPPDPPAAVDLFNGENLAGWSHFLLDDSVSRDAVWSVVDGVLVCAGTPMGYLYTDERYQDFTLSLDWRWAPGQTPGNSGVLLRIHGDAVSFLPQCVEAQLQHGNVGDLWAFYGASIDGNPKRSSVIQGHKELGDFEGIRKMRSLEKTAGEWNHYVVTVRGSNITVRLNGALVNEAHGLNVRSGPIGLQSEGGEIHFRNIQIEPL